MNNKIVLIGFLIITIGLLTGCTSNTEVDNDINTAETEDSYTQAGDAYVNYDVNLYNKTYSNNTS